MTATVTTYPTASDGGANVSSPHISQLDDLPVLISVPKAAAILGIARSSAYRYAEDGELPTRRLGGRVYVVTAGLREFIEGSEGSGVAA